MVLGFIIAGIVLIITAYITLDATADKKGKSKLYLFCCYLVGTLETAIGTVFLLRALKNLVDIII